MFLKTYLLTEKRWKYSTRKNKYLEIDIILDHSASAVRLQTVWMSPLSGQPRSNSHRSEGFGLFVPVSPALRIFQIRWSWFLYRIQELISSHRTQLLRHLTLHVSGIRIDRTGAQWVGVWSRTSAILSVFVRRIWWGAPDPLTNQEVPWESQGPGRLAGDPGVRHGYA